jgi:hypothetical protein
MSILDKDTSTISVGDIFNGMWIEKIWVGCHGADRCMAYYHTVNLDGIKLILNHDEVMALLRGKLQQVEL